MTREQKTALSFPCLIAQECARPMFSRFVDGGSLVLTVNAGYE